MDYTQSANHTISAVTGNRMHQNTTAPTTRVTKQDMNGPAWELMEIIKAHPAFAGAIAFDEANPASYSQAKEAILALIDQHFNQSGQTLIGNVLSSVSNSYLPIQNGTANNLQLAGDATTAMGAVTLQQLDGSINTLVNGAPGVLDQFNEVAAALGANPNFAADVLAALGGKVAKAGSTGAQIGIESSGKSESDLPLSYPQGVSLSVNMTPVGTTIGGSYASFSGPYGMCITYQNGLDPQLTQQHMFSGQTNYGFFSMLIRHAISGSNTWTPWFKIGGSSASTGIITNPTIAYSDINSAATGYLVDCSLSIANGQITMHRTYSAGGAGVSPVNPVTPVAPCGGVGTGGCGGGGTGGM
jgi:hypothetical protein